MIDGVPNQTGWMEHDLLRVLVGIRRSLEAMYAAVSADPLVPQQASRRFALNKNLTWKISKICGSSEPFSTVRHIPGDAGITILLDAFRKAGAPDTLTRGVREAIREFDAVVQANASDRAGLDLILDSMGVGFEESALERSRELAFRGNSGVWGVQARVKVNLAFVVPSAEKPTLLDVLHVAGFFGFRRLRSEAKWELARFRSYSDSQADSPASGESDPVSTNGDLAQGTSSLYPEFSTHGDLGILQQAVGQDTRFVLGPSPAGHKHAFDLIFRDLSRGIEQFRTKTEHRGEISSASSVPAELLIMDVLIHKDVQLGSIPKAELFGRPYLASTSPTDLRARGATIPLTDAVTQSLATPTALGIDDEPRYADLVKASQERMRVAPGDLRAYRLMVKYPVTPSVMTISWDLPTS